MGTPANVRDLGGLPMAGGGRTRTGVLIRGDALYDGDIVPADVIWPPAVVVDLRSSREADRRPFTWSAGVTTTPHDLFAEGGLDRLPMSGGLDAVYRHMLDTAAPRIAAVPTMLAGSPAFIHCAAGKDRTGVVVAALLLAAGVLPSAVIADYQLTELAMGRVLRRLEDSGGVDMSHIPNTMARAPRRAIQVVVDRLTSWPGGPGAWFLDHGADSDALDRLIVDLSPT